MKTIFISSTFKDFHAERDILQKRVLPQINDTASQVGEYVSFSDLRWGVDTTESEDKEATVLSVCLNEIDRSRPYMIVMLGDRYGFCPGEKAISEEIKSRGIILEDLDISVTALEAEYGVLSGVSNKLLRNILVYCRNIEGEGVPEEFTLEEKKYNKKLEDLKFKLKNTVPEGHYKEYTAIYDKETGTLDVSEFSEMVEKDLNTIFENEFVMYKDLDFYEKNMLRQWNYVENKAEQFEIFSDFAKSLLETLKSNISVDGLWALYGVPGAGKSTMFSYICKEMKQAGYLVIPIVCGNTRLSSDVIGILQIINNQLEIINKVKDKKDVQEPDVNQLGKSIAKLCTSAVNRKKKVLIAIDGLEALPSSQAHLLAGLMPNIMSANLKIIFTCQMSVDLPSHVNKIFMPKMNREECAQMILRIGKYRGKQIYNEVVEEILKNRSEATPLMLYLLVEHLSLLDFRELKRASKDGENAIIQMLIDTVKIIPDDVDDMAYELIKNAVSYIKSNELDDALCYMAMSKNGVRFSDIESLLLKKGKQISQLDFAWLVNYIPEMFIKRQDGRVDFFHSCLKNGINKAADEDSKKEILEDLFEYYSDGDDGLSVSECFWYAIIRKDCEFLLDCIHNKWQLYQKEYEYMEQLLYEYSLFDEGKLLMELIDRCENRTNDRLFFMSLTSKYRLNKHENEISDKIYNKLLVNVTGLALMDDEEYIVQTLSTMYGAVENGKQIPGWYGSPLHEKIKNMVSSDIFEGFKNKYLLIIVSILYELGDCEYCNGKNDQVCLSYYQQARELCKQYLDGNEEKYKEHLVADYYNITRAIADIYCQQGDDKFVALYEECLQYYRKQNEIDERCNYGVALSALTEHFRQGDLREDRIKSREYAEENVRCWKKYNSLRKHIDAKLNYAMACGQLARVYYDSASNEKQLRESLKYALDSKEGLNKLLEDNYDGRISLSVLYDINILIADIYRYLGEEENERRTYLEAVKTFKSSKDAEERCSDFILVMYERLLNADLENGKYDSQKDNEYLNEILKRLNNVKDLRNRARFEKIYHAIRGKAYLLENNNSESLREFDKALDMLEISCNYTDWFDAETLCIALQCYGHAIDFAKSNDNCNKCIEFYKNKLNKYNELIDYDNVQDYFYPIFFWITNASAELIRDEESQPDESVYRDFLKYLEIMRTRNLLFNTIIAVSDAINKCMIYFEDKCEEDYVYSLKKAISWYEDLRGDKACSEVKDLLNYYLTFSLLELSDSKLEDNPDKRIKMLEKAFDTWKYVDLKNPHVSKLPEIYDLITDTCLRLINEYEMAGNKKGASKVQKFMLSLHQGRS